MKDFQELSRRGRLSRLKELASRALHAYHLKAARMDIIQYGQNAIYRVDVSDHPENFKPFYLPNRFVLRLHAMDDMEAIASELTWLAALNQEAGLPVPTPVPLPDGNLLVKIFTPGIPNGRIVSLMRWLNGRKKGKSLQPRHLRSLGQVVAQLHTFAANWNPPIGFIRPTWDWDSQLGGSMFAHSREELVASMPIQFQEPFEAVSQQARQATKLLGKNPDAFGLIHADLYPENVLFKGDKAFPIDFEDCGYGYWIWDIAVALCVWAWESNWEHMRDAFCEGYAQFRTLPDSQWVLLDLFVATQFATMVLWASAFLKDDPLREAEYVPWRNNNGNKLLKYFELKKLDREA